MKIVYLFYLWDNVDKSLEKSLDSNTALGIKNLEENF